VLPDHLHAIWNLPPLRFFHALAADQEPLRASVARNSPTLYPCPGRVAASFTLLPRTGTRDGPRISSAPQVALRSIRGTCGDPVNDDDRAEIAKIERQPWRECGVTGRITPT
jgi:hypothetical protein